MVPPFGLSSEKIVNVKILKILASTIFSELNPKGGPFYAKVKKSKKSNFFCSKSYFFYLNMNYKCSKLSIEVSDMPYNQFFIFDTVFQNILQQYSIKNAVAIPCRKTKTKTGQINRSRDSDHFRAFQSNSTRLMIFLKNFNTHYFHFLNYHQTYPLISELIFEVALLHCVTAEFIFWSK